MHRQTASAIAVLTREDCPIVLPDDLDNILAIEQAAKDYDDAERSVAADLLDRPRAIGGTLLYRLSWAAVEWLRECAAPWWDGTELAPAAIVYAMANARKPDAFAGEMCAEKHTAARRVKKWMRAQSSSMAALTAAANELLPKPDADAAADQPDDQPKTDNVAILARLSATYAMPPEQFLYQMSADALNVYIRNMLAIQRERYALAGHKITDEADRKQAAAFVKLSTAIKSFHAAARARKAAR